MTARRFLPDDQDAFARLSGDFNPLHLDPLAARRLIFGGPVVHGVHALLWALDTVQLNTSAIVNLKVEFAAPIPVDAEVRLITETPAASRHHLKITAEDGTVATIIDVEWSATTATAAGSPAPTPGCPDAGTPRPLSPEDAANLSGHLDLYLDANLARRLFPNLAETLAPAQLAAIIAASRVVGMECPGQHSIFSGLTLEADPKAARKPVLDYRVQRVRLSLADIDISGGGLSGTIRALFRPPPTDQPSYGALAALVDGRAFADWRALIVGGSRGLGEVAAKLLAAAGADVRLTYHSGRADGERVRDEITQGGGRADCFAFDVLAPDLNGALEEGWQPSMLGFFATSHISASTGDQFFDAVYQHLADIHVDGFCATVKAVRAIAPGALSVLYPSSVYIDDAPDGMQEYTKAKQEGERAVAALAAETGFKFIAPRFPRLATDQTARLLPETSLDTGAIVLDALKRLFDAND